MNVKFNMLALYNVISLLLLPGNFSIWYKFFNTGSVELT